MPPTAHDSSQQRLGAFNDQSHSTDASSTDDGQSETDTSPDGAETGAQSHSSDTGSEDAVAGVPDKLATLYDGLTLDDYYPRSAAAVEPATALEPMTNLYTTRDLPGNIGTLPFSVGPWKLEIYSSDRAVYVCRTDAVFDEDYGDGAGLYGVELFQHRRSQPSDGDAYGYAERSLVGFENAREIVTTDLTDDSDLRSPNGYSPKNNTGDAGVFAGVRQRADTATEAAEHLLAFLHHHPGPLPAFLDDCRVSQHWTCTKIYPRRGVWEAPTPPTVDATTLRLTLTADTLQLTANDPGAPIPDRDVFSIPSVPSVPDELATTDDTSTAFETPAAAYTALRDLLAKPPQQLLDG